jgi:enamine deaminase RidA (YjgF/YER057c/UK114 family)
MDVTLIRSPRLFDGAPYAYAAIARGAGAVFTAGACPLDERGQVTAPGDIPAQARQALANLAVALDDAGATIRDVVKTTVYVASIDRTDLVAAWDQVAAFFGDHDAPSTLLGVTVLGYPGQLAEIEAVAAVQETAEKGEARWRRTSCRPRSRALFRRPIRRTPTRSRRRSRTTPT